MQLAHTPGAAKRPASSDGNARSTKSRKPVIGPTAPGNPEEPSSFLRTGNSESRLAAYIGFTSTSELRKFLLSAPVLEAAIAYNNNHTSRFNQVHELLHREETKLKEEMRTDMETSNQQASDGEPDYGDGQKLADQRMFAKTLLRMEDSIKNTNITHAFLNQQEFGRV